MHSGEAPSDGVVFGVVGGPVQIANCCSAASRPRHPLDFRAGKRLGDLKVDYAFTGFDRDD